MNLPQGPELRQVLGLVQHDPGVVARLLRVVNSACYGQRSSVTSVWRAVVVLGTVSVTGIVMGMAMQDVQANMAAVVNAANKAANALGCTLNHEVDWDDCSQDPIWEYMIAEQKSVS